MRATDRPSFRYRTYLVLEGGVTAGLRSVAARAFLIALIVANVIAYILQSVPWAREGHLSELKWFETASVAIFAVEYALRVWTAAALDNAIVRARKAERNMMSADSAGQILADDAFVTIARIAARAR